MDLKRTLSPIRIGSVDIPNRVVRTGHVTQLSSMGPLNDALIGYHEARAKGGVGLTILEAFAVHPSSALSLIAWYAGLVEGYRRLMDAVRPHGMRIFQQLWHGGHIYPQPDGSPPLAPSPLPHYVGSVRPLTIMPAQIASIVEGDAAASALAEDGGLDGVEVHAGHGYLISQFLSPVLNQREDAWGGPLENRMRFLVDILRAIRERVSANFVVGVRVSESSAVGVLASEEVRELVTRLEADGLIDYLNVSHGDYYRMDEQIASMVEPAGYQLPSAGAITAVSRLPRIVTGRFRTLEEVEQVLREGTADLVSMVRAHIADPDIVRKTIEHGPDRVRPCLACNQGCVERTHTGGRLGCVINPAVGREASLSEDLIGATDNPRKVLVIGGGPAGLEAARAAALRGHEVVLAEAMPSLGGALKLIANAPRLATFGDYRHWVESEVYRLGVDVRTSAYVEATDIPAYGADTVIVATGALPDDSGFQVNHPSRPMRTAPGARVISSMDLFSDPDADWGQHAVVYDDVGAYEAIACAEHLVGRGLYVTFVTRRQMFGQMLERTARNEPALERLGGSGLFHLRLRAAILEARPGEAEIKAYGYPVETVKADTVVFVGFKQPNDELCGELESGGVAFVRVGDVLSPRDLQIAIREGHLAGRAIA